MTISTHGILKSEVEYVFFSMTCLMIIPCVTLNIVIIWRILKRNQYAVFSISPKTINLYFNLAICDVTMGLLAMPWTLYYIQIGRPEPGDKNHNIFNETLGHRVFCTVSGYTYNVVTRVTCLVILILGIDRTHAIYYPLTYSREIYNSVYKYATFLVWGFALGTSALPFLAGIPYIEQPTRELQCSWSVTELLGLNQTEIPDNKIQLFFLYFLLIDIPVVIPTAVSVMLSFAVLIKIHIKRWKHISETQTPKLYNFQEDVQQVTYSSDILDKLKALFTLDASKDQPKLQKLTRASFTMLMITTLYFVLYFYWWAYCLLVTLVLLDVSVPVIERRMSDPTMQYINNSYHMSAFLHATLAPIIVYTRVIKSYQGTRSRDCSRGHDHADMSDKDGACCRFGLLHTIKHLMTCCPINNARNRKKKSMTGSKTDVTGITSPPRKESVLAADQIVVTPFNGRNLSEFFVPSNAETEKIISNSQRFV